jgi:hypothetical protein
MSNIIKAELLKCFPQLDTGHFEITSPPTIDYNCIGFAAGDETHWWQPGQHWPLCEPKLTLESYVATFEKLGYKACKSRDLEKKFEKVAIFMCGNDIDSIHMSRQLPTGIWKSKCGSSYDIEHALSGLEGGMYGDVIMTMRRSNQKKTEFPWFDSAVKNALVTMRYVVAALKK